MTDAAKIIEALHAQTVSVDQHVTRLIETRDRYMRGTIPWAEAELRRVVWLEIRRVLTAVSEGKTVPPS